jgi:cyclopropane-fatty-acyl-phospholipid synthase
MSLLSLGVAAVERGFVPDACTRIAIRSLCRSRLHESMHGDARLTAERRTAFLDSMRSGPIAPVPEKANEQHYELPPEFFTAVLGPRRKYSCCYWPEASTTLAEAEEAALAITCQQAELVDGQQVLELGCGWGSLSLWMAGRYPNSRITAVSNSVSQRQFIEAKAIARGLTNLRIITADMNDFDPMIATSDGGRFDRVISVEMFEHMRNYDLLLGRIASWLQPAGKLFVHLFCHRELAYPFESNGAADWMGRYFFTGGIMPSKDLLRRFDRNLSVVSEWTWAGCHYQRTAEAWLANLDARRNAAIEILRSSYGETESRRWFHRWRIFFLAVAELFGYCNGQEWQVSQYLLERTSQRAN